MGCGSSKTIVSDTVTRTQRIEIIPRDIAPNTDVPTRPTTTPKYSRSLSAPRHTTPDLTGQQNTPPHPPHAHRSPGSVAALSVRRKRLTLSESRKSNLISVEPQRVDPIDIAHRQISAGSRVTTDSGFGEESRGGLSAESARTGGDEAVEFITEQSNPNRVEMVQHAERPVTPELLIEGISCLPPLRKTATYSKLVNISGAVDGVIPGSPQNILEKAPLPPIHSQNKRPRPSSAGEISHSPTMELEQDLDIVNRPSSRGGMAFDILLGVPTSKRQSLQPIEFGSEGKQGRSADKLTKESIDAKLAAAEKRRKEREQDVVNNLIGQREVDEKKMKEQYERFKKSLCDKESNLSERMRTTSENREVQIFAKVSQAQKVKEKVEIARQARKSIPLIPQD